MVMLRHEIFVVLADMKSEIHFVCFEKFDRNFVSRNFAEISIQILTIQFVTCQFYVSLVCVWSLKIAMIWISVKYSKTICLRTKLYSNINYQSYSHLSQ